jgi:hypothetical protein
MVTAGFEGDVGGGAFGGEAAFRRLFQGYDLGVVALVVDVGAFSEDFVVADEDATNLRIWRCKGCSVRGEPKCMLHKNLVLKVRRHHVEDSWFLVCASKRG